MPLKSTFSGPLSQKVLVGAIASAATGAFTWIATTYIWKAGIPVNLKGLIDALGTGVGYFGGAYLAKHNITPAELTGAIKQINELHATVHPSANPTINQLSEAASTLGLEVVPVVAQIKHGNDYVKKAYGTEPAVADVSQYPQSETVASGGATPVDLSTDTTVPETDTESPQ